jgi:hypothetical protein
VLTGFTTVGVNVGRRLAAYLVDALLLAAIPRLTKPTDQLLSFDVLDCWPIATRLNSDRR